MFFLLVFVDFSSISFDFHWFGKIFIDYLILFKNSVTNFDFFFYLQPNRTYYLEDAEGYALEWCQAIEDVRVHIYGNLS